MPLRRAPSRIPLALAFFLALSGACSGGDDDDAPAQSESKPGPDVPQPPAERSLVAEGEIEITPATGDASRAALVTKVVSNTVTNGKESGYALRMLCSSTAAKVEIAMYFPQGNEIIRVERQNDRWLVNGRSADVVPSTPSSTTVDDAGARDADADADATAPSPPADPSFVDGVGLPGVDGRRDVRVALLVDGVRYDVEATIPWLASTAPATCPVSATSAGTKDSGGGGGCGSGSSSRRSSGGDWD